MIHAELIVLRSVGIQPPGRTDLSFQGESIALCHLSCDRALGAGLDPTDPGRMISPVNHANPSRLSLRTSLVSK